MEHEAFTAFLKAVIPTGFGIGLLFLLIQWIRLEMFVYRNQKAEVETCHAAAYSKDPEVSWLPQGRASSSVHHITFHTDSGDIVTLYMGPRDYYSIEEGSQGMLTWQGTRFWSFHQDAP